MRVILSRVIVCFLLMLSVGCRELSDGKAGDGAAHTKSISTHQGLIDYLLREKLPGVEKVDSWAGAIDNGIRITTTHYDIYTTLTDPLLLREMPCFLESCFLAYGEFSGVDHLASGKFKIYLFGKRSQWETFTIMRTGEQAKDFLKIKAGGFFCEDFCAAYNIGRDRTFRLLAHECWHQYCDNVFTYRLPSWLNEGIAMQFEAYRFEEGEFKFTPAENQYRLECLGNALGGGKRFALQDLLTVNPGLLAGSDNDAMRIFYGQCYGLVRFLREDRLAGKKRAFGKMLTDAAGGKWELGDEAESAGDRNIALTAGWNKKVGQKIFADYISSDVNETDRQYISFCRKITGQTVRFSKGEENSQ